MDFSIERSNSDVELSIDSVTVTMPEEKFVITVSECFYPHEVFPIGDVDPPKDDHEPFFPNTLTVEDVDNLKPWQLLVAVIHLSPKMTDCVELNYSYTVRNGHIYCNEVSLQNDVDTQSPFEAMVKYLDFSSSDVLRYALKRRLADV